MFKRNLLLIIAFIFLLFFINHYHKIVFTDNKSNSIDIYINQDILNKNNHHNIASSTNILKTHSKIVYLTFDDGPTKNIYKILDILDKYDAKVTFFFVASKLSTYRNQVKAAVSKGHAIGSHSFSHIAEEVYGSIDSFKEDLFLWQDTFYKELGFIPTLYRFPFGSNSNYIYIKNDKYCLSRLAIKILNENNILYVDWNVTSGDGNKITSKEDIYNRVIKGMDEKDNPIILLHEWNDNTLSVIDKILKYGKDKGYEFKALNKDVKVTQFVN